jgi:hypothetical protein
VHGKKFVHNNVVRDRILYLQKKDYIVLGTYISPIKPFLNGSFKIPFAESDWGGGANLGMTDFFLNPF